MSAENQSSKVATAGFTPREMEIAFLAWRAIDSGGSDLKFDYNKLAEIGNFKNAASARACFGPIKKKLLEGNTGGGASASPAAGGNGGAAADNKKAPRGKKREKETAPTAEGDDANGGGGDNGETPTKKARKTPVKKTKALPASVVDAPDEDLEDVV